MECFLFFANRLEIPSHSRQCANSVYKVCIFVKPACHLRQFFVRVPASAHLEMQQRRRTTDTDQQKKRGQTPLFREFVENPTAFPFLHHGRATSPSHASFFVTVYEASKRKDQAVCFLSVRANPSRLVTRSNTVDGSGIAAPLPVPEFPKFCFHRL